MGGMNVAIGPQLDRVIRDPEWLLHRFDESTDAFRFVRATRATHRKATFLTDEFLPEHQSFVSVPREMAALATNRDAPMHFFFHSAYCCSTLLARAFDLEGASMTLKEPMALNDLAGWKRRGAEPRLVAMVLDQVLQFLGRPFAPGETVIIKPSNVINVLAPAMLAMRPDSKAVLLYAPLPLYLASIAKKGMWGRLWVRELLQRQLEDGMVDYGFTGTDYFRQTDLQTAAVGWLAQQALYRRLIERFGPERVRTLNSEHLLASPGEALAAIVALFGLGWPTETIEQVTTSDVFSSHSKLGGAYDTRSREAEQQVASAAHAEEIAMVTRWAEEVATRRGQILEASAPLIAI